METKRLHMFKVLVETGNLRKAAELIGISHSGLSKAISVLESELGVELTTKDGRGIKITVEGEFLYKQLDSFLAAEDLLLSNLLQENRNPKSIIKIGTFETFSTYLLPELLKNLGESIELEMRELIPGKIEEAIVDGIIDYGITYLPIPNPKLDHLEICRVGMSIYMRNESQFKNTSFEQLPFVIPITPIVGVPTRVKGLDGWPDSTYPRNIKFKVSLLESAMAIVRQDLAVAYLPDYIARLSNLSTLKNMNLMQKRFNCMKFENQPVYLVKTKVQKENEIFKKLAVVLRKLK